MSALKSGIGRDLIEIAVADVKSLGRAASILERVTASTPVVDRGGRRVHAQTAGGVGALSAVVAAVEDARVPVDEIGLRHPNLDEVFLALTSEEER